MLVFWFAASVMIALALAFVLPALFTGLAPASPSRTAFNLTLYRDRRHELHVEHAAGNIDDDAFATSLLDLDRALLRDTGEEDAGHHRSTVRNPYPAILVAVLLPLTAFGLYLQLGTPEALLAKSGGARESPQAAAGARPSGVPHSVQEMVTRLEQRLREDPADAEGWLMLGRSYAAMNRQQAAREALEEASRQRPDHALTLVALAEVVARQQGGRLDGEPIVLVERALAVDPQFARGLWLAGVYAFDHGDPARARDLWQRLAAIPGLSPEAAGRIREAIQRTESTSDTAAAKAAGAQARVVASVALSDALAARLDGGEALFVFAQATTGPKIPLAVARRRADELPLTVTLDDSMAMSPQARLSSFREVVVSARISHSGSASPSPGDLLGRSEAVSPGAATEVQVIIDRVVK